MVEERSTGTGSSGNGDLQNKFLNLLFATETSASAFRSVTGDLQTEHGMNDIAQTKWDLYFKKELHIK